MHIYLTPIPVGLNPRPPTERKSILRFYNGDAMIIRTQANWPDGTRATPDNSTLVFRLTDDRFQTVAIWEGRWRAGVERDGQVVEITVPADISARLNRGSYLFSLCMAGPTGADRRTLLAGSMLVEYAPTSPNQSVPYKEPGWSPAGA